MHNRVAVWVNMLAFLFDACYRTGSKRFRVILGVPNIDSEIFNIEIYLLDRHAPKVEKKGMDIKEQNVVLIIDSTTSVMLVYRV